MRNLSIFAFLLSAVGLLHGRAFLFKFSGGHPAGGLRVIRASISSNDRRDNDGLVHGGYNHCAVIVKDVKRSIQLYQEVFGAVDVSSTRPALPFPGAFLNFGQAQIHLMELENPDSVDNRPAHGGRDRHLALWINNIDIMKSRLDLQNIPYTVSKSGRRALFCRDYDGNGFEFVEDPSL